MSLLLQSLKMKNNAWSLGLLRVTSLEKVHSGSCLQNRPCGVAKQRKDSAASDRTVSRLYA